MDKQFKINNNKGLEKYLNSFKNLVNEYCECPNTCLSKLIQSKYFDFFFIVASYRDTLLKPEQEETEAITRKLNHAYGRYLDRREDHWTRYNKKKYSY